MNDGFGWWLSGLTDGEGCFFLQVYRCRGREAYRACFQISLRADDRRALELIHEHFRVGSILRTSARKNSRPVLRFVVTAWKDLATVIVPHYQRYPLIAKKRKDFEIWKTAVLLGNRVSARKTQSLGGRRGGLPKWLNSERKSFVLLNRMLKRQRAYFGSDVVSDFDEQGWLRDFAESSRALHGLCETWIYHHGFEHGDGGECETCKDVEVILRALRDSRMIKWEGVFDRRFLCAHCGVIPHWEAGQQERDEVCLHVCRRCGGVVEDWPVIREANESKK